jgi:hypothetical protein
MSVLCAPVHWDRINLTGDYTWRQNKHVEKGCCLAEGICVRRCPLLKGSRSSSEQLLNGGMHD